MSRQQDIFTLRVTGSKDGQIIAVYIQLRQTKACQTTEVVENTVLADYDRQGKLVGIELLAPAKIRVLANLVPEELRAAFREFAKQSIPAALKAA